ncbi:DUF6444 domain-containing protein [Nonomuraea zeae]|uniref:DUF6444 domain-containing protein n=1 Tax=Nonomuraea zeae TaxID=1642303 RepID=A0A5S4GW14_9ACTN|nr:DUF6444 domain-containing protein [Nonomuraea zeae]TMR36922.1 hypothetical protein ETD85_09200 [Nonomuraea zeae]
MTALEEMRAAIAERDAVIKALLAEVEQLKRRAGMDSSNSSMPPGSNGPAARAKRAKRPKKRSPRWAGRARADLAQRSGPDQHPRPRSMRRVRLQAGRPDEKIVARVQMFDTHR